MMNLHFSFLSGSKMTPAYNRITPVVFDRICIKYSSDSHMHNALCFISDKILATLSMPYCYYYCCFPWVFEIIRIDVYIILNPNI
jgi:hypothetical protein